MEGLVCVSDFELAAAKILDRNALEYYRSGADDESTLADNNTAYKRWVIKPRVMRDISNRNLSTVVLGKPVNFPVGISPSAMQKLGHPDGEVAMIKAAESLGSIYILSTNSTTSIEDVAASAPKARKWFQLYVFKDRNMSIDLVRRAEKAGFEALVLTVDAPLFGRRRANIRNKFSLPTNLRLSNFPSEEMTKSDGGSALNNFLDNMLDQSLTWEDFVWLKNMTRLPIILKGIMCPDDARLAVQHGADGIFVSNHGARQLDTVFATLDALPAIVKEVDGKCEVYVDGGISTGSSVFKALALGANMVFVGRAPLWGLAVNGQQGAARVLQIYKEELELTMAAAGTANVKDIDSSFVSRKSQL